MKTPRFDFDFSHTWAGDSHAVSIGFIAYADKRTIRLAAALLFVVFGVNVTFRP